MRSSFIFLTLVPLNHLQIPDYRNEHLIRFRGAQLLSLHIQKLRIAAKLTHIMYGMSKIPAVFDTFMKSIIVNAIEIHMMEISIRPARGNRSPKKATDHSTFRINCTAKMMRAFWI
jgi:hypothetical protein